jgi:intracellular septation protein
MSRILKRSFDQRQAIGLERERKIAMKHALVHLFSDLLSTIVFLAIYALTGSILITTIAGVTTGAIQIARLKFRGETIDTMQWASLGLVVVFGGAALVTQDPRFIMIKPTLIQFAIGAVMLRRGWMERYLPQIVHDRVPAAMIVGAGYGWAGLMFALGLGNLAAVATGNIHIWAVYLSVVPVAAKFAAFGVQYLSFRVAVRRSLRQSALTTT